MPKVPVVDETSNPCCDPSPRLLIPEKAKSTSLSALRRPQAPQWCPGCAYHTLRQALEICFSKRPVDGRPLVVTGVGCIEEFVSCLAVTGIVAPPGNVLDIAGGAALGQSGNMLVLLGDGELRRSPASLLRAQAESSSFTCLYCNNSFDDPFPDIGVGGSEEHLLSDLDSPELAALIAQALSRNGFNLIHLRLACKKQRAANDGGRKNHDASRVP